MPHRGALANLPHEEARRVFAQHVVRYEGNILRIAHFMGYGRAHVYRLIRRYHMWPLINRVRQEQRARRRRERQEQDHGV